MRQPELLNCGLSAFQMLDGVKELRILAQRARDRPQAPDVLRMPPPGVVAPAIAMGDKRGPHRGACREWLALLDRTPTAVGNQKNRAVLRRCRRNRGGFIKDLEAV